ncbi:hypothetical protein FPV67DRAFT_1668891 [Lyophyllum atratum]|nr:hypothetical protein FPV67DRAFT_1668891 [Lyophyllum atratum]
MANREVASRRLEIIHELYRCNALLAANYTSPDRHDNNTRSYSPTISSASSLTPSRSPSPNKALRSPFEFLTPEPKSPAEPEDSPPENHQPEPSPTLDDEDMAKDETPFFRGDYTADEKPHTWFRRLEVKFNENTTHQAKLYQFQKNLDPGRKAEKWFQALEPTQKLTWDTLYAAFTLKWPLPTIVEPTRDELLARLDSTILETDMLGKLVGDDDKVYSHVKWATDIRALTDALDDDKGHLIARVRCDLPLIVRRLLPITGIDTWHLFLTAVTTIPLHRIKDELEDWKSRHPEAAPSHPDGWQKDMAALTSHLAQSAVLTPTRAPPPSYQYRSAVPSYQPPARQTPAAPAPPAAQRQAPPHMLAPSSTNALTRPNAPQTPAAGGQHFATPASNESNPFLSSTPAAPGTLFNPRTPATNMPPQTPSPNRIGNAELARHAVEIAMLFPNTPEGVKLYTSTMASWEAIHGMVREVDFLCQPYPLTPGTEKIGSRECFKCGYSGHIARQCDNQQVNRREQRWRGLIGRCLFGMGGRAGDSFGVLQISAVEETLPYDPAIYDAGSLEFEEDYGESGKDLGARE